VNRYQVTAKAKPSGVVFYFRVTPANHTPAHVDASAKSIAQRLNAEVALPEVLGIRVEQDIDASNQVTQSVVGTIQSTSGDSTTEITEPWGSIFNSDFRDAAEAARDALDAVEAL
jgi:hypothetical protein